MSQPFRCIAKKQPAVAMSKDEAKYRAMDEVMQRAVYTRTMTTTFDSKRTPIIMENDNMSATTMLSSLGATKRSKFIDLLHQYLKQMARGTKISIQHVPSKMCRADMFTGPLERRRFEELRDMIEFIEIPDL